jgi:hypothetical protein
MALPRDKMRENEELFRLANERLREQVAAAEHGEFVVRVLGSFHAVRKEAA